MIQTIQWIADAARVLDQRKLPTELSYLTITDEKQMWEAIKTLAIRGAPAIGVAAAYGLYLGIRNALDDPPLFNQRLKEVSKYLASARPTAVNLAWALQRIARIAPGPDPKPRILAECHTILEEDIQACKSIGEYGLKLLQTITPGPLEILTHCNAGALATVRYGTALAPIYLAAERGIPVHVFADETRPLLQGARITAFELQQAGIPVTVLCDNMAATILRDRKVTAVIVGADRIAANGDVGNKIGTLGVAILAKHFKIPFFVAAPMSTIDFAIKDGTEIPIEQRDPLEVSAGLGKQTAPTGVDIYNPAFDVTPADLITAIITDCGTVAPNSLSQVGGY